MTRLVHRCQHTAHNPSPHIQGPAPTPKQVVPLKEMTLDELAGHAGTDPAKPLYLAIKGTVFNVTKGSQFYGPDGVCCPRGQGSLRPTRLALACLRPQQQPRPRWLSALHASLASLRAPHLPVTLQVRAHSCKLRTRTPAPRTPRTCAGVYPFAGKECARALALMSTEEADCHGDLEGLGYTELDILRDWEAKFYFKYPVVGKIVGGKAG